MSQLRALVVEDDHRILPTIGDALFSMGHDYVHVTNQEEAQQRLNDESFDYVLLDLQIPTRPHRGGATIECGANLLRWIRGARQLEVPVIIMTGYSQECLRLARELIRDGAEDFIPKPFQDQGRTLGSVIRRVMGHGETAEAATSAEASPPDTTTGWLTVTQAAELLLEDVDGLDLKRARSRVSSAANNGKFKTNGMTRGRRRIDPDSFCRWRLEQRERNLDRVDAFE